MHAATEILEGERTNLIIWMYRTPDPDDVFGYDHDAYNNDTYDDTLNRTYNNSCEDTSEKFP